MVDIKVVEKPEVAESKAKKLSGVSYPYFDLDDSLRVSEAIHTKGGGVCDVDQLGAWLNYKSTSSGTFASRLSSARHFGLIGPTKGGRIGITDRARAILAPVMATDAVSARADAFLSVSLYKTIFERFRGNVLPPDVGLTNLFIHEYKILPDRAGHALRVFKDSATQAGFFSSAHDRLIRPAGSLGPTGNPINQQTVKVASETPMPELERRKTAGGGGDGSGVDPSVLGLLRRLPQPGDAWAQSDQDAFLKAFEAVVKFLYPVKDEG